jgi:E3 ubiquitin-protein ligase HECTD4
VCGLPEIDLGFLRRHTTYTSGLSEGDQHVAFFWEVLEELSQEELRKFVKFACNQERIPMEAPAASSADQLVHVPPYPMKIAPPDEVARGKAGSIDQRLIRAETCMFMIKLPQYSTKVGTKRCLRWLEALLLVQLTKVLVLPRQL